MKSLKNFIIESTDNDKSEDKNSTIDQNIKKDNDAESQKNTVEATHTITLDFTNLKDSKDIIKSLESYDICVIDENKVTINANKEEISKAQEVTDIINKYVETLRKSPERAANEAYAQKIKSFAAKLDNLKEYINQVNGENSEEE